MALADFVPSYESFLQNTMTKGLLLGIYSFLTGMGILSTNEQVQGNVDFISAAIFNSWGDDSDYYITSQLIWTFLLDDKIGVCNHSKAIRCEFLTWFWIFIATLNVWITFPLSHVAAVYSWSMDLWSNIKFVL